MRTPSPFLLVAVASLALAACGRKDSDTSNIAALDNQLTGNAAEASLSNELASQIAVDANLVGGPGDKAAGNVAAPAEAGKAPPSNAAKPGPGPAAAQPAAGPAATGGCSLDVKFAYGNGWANRLPEAFPVYPGGRVTEAAGNDTGACRMRVVSFTAGADWQRVLDWYNTQAVRAGYSSEHQLKDGDHVLAGAKGDAAYYLIVTPKGSESDVSLIVNNGR